MGESMWLPPVRVDDASTVFRLPLRDRTAALIGTWVLIDDPDAVANSVVAAMLDDPALFIDATLFHHGEHYSTDSVTTSSPAAIGGVARTYAKTITGRLCDDDRVGLPTIDTDACTRATNFFRTLSPHRWMGHADVWLNLWTSACEKPNCHPQSNFPRVCDASIEHALSERGSSPPGIDMLSVVAGHVRRHRELRDAFDRTLDESKRQMAGRLAHGVGHELNNPLANVAMAAESITAALARTPPQTDAAVTLAASITEQAFRGHAMIADLMAWSDPPAITRVSTDVIALLESLINEFRRHEPSIEWILKSRPDRRFGGVMCDVDPVFFGEAVRQILRNSADAITHSESAAGGRVVVIIRDDGDDVVIEVCDSGPGFDADSRQHALTPYHSGREAGRGQGMGLCRATQIIESHGGRLDLPVVAIGAVVRITLPSPVQKSA